MSSISGVSPFPPIAEYAFLSNCHTGALVAPDGSVDWLCVPRLDSPSVFGSLLDRGSGYFRFGPYGINVPTSRTYVPGTNVLLTTWHTASGWLEVREALTMVPRTGPDETTPHTRPPADDDAEHLLVRTAVCLGGSVEVEAVCEPAFDYGRAPGVWELLERDGNPADVSAGDTAMRMHSSLNLGVEGSAVKGRHVLKEGETAFCALSWGATLGGPNDYEDAARRIDSTVEFWRRWLGRARIPDHPLRTYVERSALTIKGLTYMPTGATVAALTTSLPETPGGERNWDWLPFSPLAAAVLLAAVVTMAPTAVRHVSDATDTYHDGVFSQAAPRFCTSTDVLTPSNRIRTKIVRHSDGWSNTISSRYRKWVHCTARQMTPTMWCTTKLVDGFSGICITPQPKAAGTSPCADPALDVRSVYFPHTGRLAITCVNRASPPGAPRPAPTPAATPRPPGSTSSAHA